MAKKSDSALFLKEKDEKNLLGKSIWLSLILIILLLIIYILVRMLDNELAEKLVQGEVLVGVAIAFPTLTSWFFARRVSEEQSKRQAREQAWDIIKHYDDMIYNEVNISDKNSILSISDAYKVTHIISTFKELITPYEEDLNSKFQLDYPHLLTKLCILEEKNFDDINDIFSDNELKGAISLATLPVLEEIYRHGNQKVLEDNSVKTFVLVKFDFRNFFKSENSENDMSVEFFGKTFLECSFSYDYFIKQQYKSNNFINCTIESDEGDIVDMLIDTLKINNNKIKGKMTIISNGEQRDIYQSELEESTDLKHSGTVIVEDFRDNILVNSFINSNVYPLNVSTLDSKKLKEEIMEKLIGLAKLEQININYDNSRISISKDYKSEKNESKYGPLKWLGWHSIYDKQLQEGLNKEYYIFIVKSEKKAFAIIFSENNFKEYLNRKTVDATGKYNFYFGEKKISNSIKV